MEITPLLQQFGLNDKEITIYLTLLKLGPSSVRNLAATSELNRGTAYDILKSLKAQGLVSYFHQATKQLFVAEDPSKLINVLEQKTRDLENVKNKLEQAIPQLKSMYDQSGEKPVVRYYEGLAGIKFILNDVLESVVKNSSYCVFSSANIRDYLYQALPNFTKQRIIKGIKVKAIAIGHKGTPAELAETKSLGSKESWPSYILIYHNKVAMISVNSAKQPLGMIIEDQAIYETQKQVFEFMWSNL